MQNAGVKPSRHGLTGHGLRNWDVAYWNLGTAKLVEAAIQRHEGELANTGALVVRTGHFTGRSPKDKYIVRDAATENTIAWGSVNQPMAPERFTALYEKLLSFWQGRTLFVQDCLAGADPAHQIKVRVITETAWHSLFGRQLLIRTPYEELQDQAPDFTIMFAPTFQARPEQDGTHSGTVIAINFTERLVLIAGTMYAGELKKSVFTILNHLLPDRGVLPMHCSANVGAEGDVALFFGLSGTGKTTLSADAARGLIGDDEHGWSSGGVFNFEGGCYAKCIRLSQRHEPEIWDAIRFGTVLENVVLDADRRNCDYASGEFTENTRAAYRIEFMGNAVIPSLGGHPRNILFLAADAFGVLPPIARLTPEQAMFHFLSGYTAKLAGTERGLGNEPVATFSACFGEPFLPRPAQVYAGMLGRLMREHNVNCWLVNTGWVGGAYGTGDRMSLPHTRAMVNAAIAGQLDGVAAEPHPVFGVLTPKQCPGVPGSLLDARAQWASPEAYDTAAAELARRFRKNFERFGAVDAAITKAGPRV
ncbi:MAG: phosphoenolpyruvate carboxykinase (ATP) [Bryobacterales bacterium]|nr:phosphoenolpyruvate carboxykinase (ATP) [Bryobacterales bacterium]